MDTETRLAERLRRMPGVRTVPRPVLPGRGTEFDLAYVRDGRPGGTPLLAVPGGPGMASVLPYRSVRRSAARLGFDAVMAEHRGVGLSRRDRGGADLPPAALTLAAAADDLAAVLDDCGIGRAVVWGASYGGVLAQVFAGRHPGRVAGLVLDSTSGSTRADHAEVREYVRGLLWRGEAPEAAGAAERLRDLVEQGAVPADECQDVVPVVYEFGGPAMVERLLEAVARGRTGTWRRVRRLAGKEAGERSPCVLEFDLVSEIWRRELHDLEPDGRPLDPAAAFAQVTAGREPDFAGLPVDAEAVQRGLSVPVAVLSGAYDLRAVPPGAEAMAGRIPDAALVRFPRSGHGFLDRFPFAGLVAAGAVAAGRHKRLPGLAERLEAGRRVTSATAMRGYLAASLAMDGVPFPR
ncbi:alpha/beta hydrolase [Nocardiopsis suaedae]|uniref:Alpha/beta hydrolase n=1 Tax=Nocardiopsis suaedae TaxID=3018444 RepID=A0ABT4TUE7_9ACTN|nr:alpha/beta hydrolase [Nocardiopsis suaedae]MDA2808328.1 alpha/beta hydrolase [Nocardiopsis suaedae]